MNRCMEMMICLSCIAAVALTAYDTTPLDIGVRPLSFLLLLSCDAVAAVQLPVRSPHSARLAACCTPCLTGETARPRADRDEIKRDAGTNLPLKWILGEERRKS